MPAGLPENWNLMDACAQAAWRNGGRATRCDPGYRLAPPPPVSAPRCGRACGELWTDEDFAANRREIERLEREIASLSRGLAAPPSQPTPLYTPSYTTRRTGSTYDWQSGNSYSWYRDSLGSTNVNGMNLGTGSMWQTQIRRNGSMTGWDKDLNYWSYDAGTKTYINFGTGTLCVGEGYARVCTGGSK